MSLMGQKTNPSRAKIQLCPLWSKSRQTRVRSVCPLSANNGRLHRRKAASIFGVSDEPPYGISMPGAGAVQQITS
jgi:hypothetical protein